MKRQIGQKTRGIGSLNWAEQEEIVSTPFFESLIKLEVKDGN